MTRLLLRLILVPTLALALAPSLLAYDRDLERVFDCMEREQIAQEELASSKYLLFAGGDAFYGTFGDAGYFSMSGYDDFRDKFHLGFSLANASEDGAASFGQGSTEKSITRSLAYFSLKKPFRLPFSVLAGLSGISKANMGFDGPGTFTSIEWRPDGGYTLNYFDPFFKLGLELGSLSLDGYYAGTLNAFKPLYSYLTPGIHAFKDALNLAVIAESYQSPTGGGKIDAYLGARARFGKQGKPPAGEDEKGWSRLSLDLRFYNIEPIDAKDVVGFLKTSAIDPANYVARGTAKLAAATRKGALDPAELYATAGAWYGLDRGFGYELALTLDAPFSMSLSGFARMNDYLSVPVRGGSPDYSLGVMFNFGFGFGRGK